MDPGPHPLPAHRPLTAAGRELAALGFGHDPIARPLTYPGRGPRESGLLVDGCLLALRGAPGTPPGRRLVDVSAVPPQVFGVPAVPLDDVLRHCGRPVMTDRQPVLAVGSNASPAQVARKLAGRARAVVPMTYARVAGLAIGASAHVSAPGYVPATPVVDGGHRARLVVLWLDEEQLAAVDATEPNYHRARIPDPATVSVPGLGALPDCHLYAGRHGCLVDGRGVPIRPAGQAELLTGLLADSPGLPALVDARTPEEFVARTRSAPALRDAVRALWRREGRARHQPELTAGRIAPG